MENSPFSVCYLILTEDCNLRCKYCYENASRCKNNYMSLDTAEKTVDFLINNALEFGIKNLSWKFFGGEPLLNFDVMVDLYYYILEKGKNHNIEMFFGLITNGTIYNSKFEEFILEFCKADNIINISIDGIPEVQDENRRTINNEPTSEIVSKNILRLKMLFEKKNIKSNCLNTHSVISKDNMSKIFLNYKYFEHLGVDNIRFDLSYDEIWKENDIAKYIEQLSLIADYVYEKCITVGSLIPYQKANMINDLKPFNSINDTCKAGKTICTIAPNGDIYPCQRTYFYDPVFYKLGNVHNGIIDDNKRKIFFEAHRSEMHVNNTSCSTCDNTACKICMLLNFEERKDILKCNPANCAVYKAKWDFIIATKKKFYKLFNAYNYNKCNEISIK